MPRRPVTFRCGHPREDNTYQNKQCALCKRVRAICKSVELAQKRINAGGYTRGERVCAA